MRNYEAKRYSGMATLARTLEPRFALSILAGAALLGAALAWYFSPGTAPAASPAAAVAPVALPEPLQKTLALEVKPGATLLGVLTGQNVPATEAHEIVAAVRKVYNPRKLGAGDAIVMQVEKDAPGSPDVSVSSLSIAVSPLSSIELNRSSGGAFDVREVRIPVTRDLTRATGQINSSLYEAGMAAGVPPALLGEVIKAYSYDVDFQRDIKSGDRFDILFERMKTPTGTTAAHGNIIYATLNTKGKDVTLYRYADARGNADYYNAKGESVRKALLRTPIPGARISSRFGMRRHPILGYSKLHKGVDFAAGTGTPIYAAGDGVVEFAGRKGGYGNYVKLRHNGKYATAYGHISRFASGTRPGRKVKQGQVIAYVGSTGRSTGPHLHYEVLAGSKQVNPAGIKFKTGNVLTGRELASFKHEVQTVQAALNNTTPTTMQAALDITAR